MPLIVNAAGNVTANPATGKINSGSKPASAKPTQSLWGALGGNNLIPTTSQPTTGSAALRADLDRAVAEGIRPTITQQRRSVSSSSPLNAPVSLAPQRAPQVSQPLFSSAPVGTAAATGASQITEPITADDVSKRVKEDVLEPIGIDMDRQAGLDVWEQQAAQKENRAPRTSNLFDEEYDMDGSPIGWADNQLNYIGNTPTNDAYLRAAVDDGLSMDDAWAILHKPDSIDAEKEMNATRKVSPDIYDDLGKVMDDGTKYDYAHMTSDKMTGAQYLKYAEMGMGGRPVEQIDPSEVYSKRREQNEYGFIPFTPDTSTYMNQMVGNAIEFPGRLGTMVGGLRQAVTPDYEISYGEGGDRKSISGRDFDKLSRPYINQFYYNHQFNPEKFLTGQDVSTAHILENTVPDVNGNDTYHYGHLTNVDANEDGTFSLGFSDGSSVDISRDYFDTVYDENTGSLTLPPGESIPASQAKGTLPKDMAALNDVDSLVKLARQNGGSPMDYADVVFVPDLVLSDGTRLPFEDAQRLYFDQSPEDDADNATDDDIRYGFQNTLFFDNKPNRLMEQEPISISPNGGFEFSGNDMGNNALDWTLGSLPISIGRALPWLYSASKGSVSLTGADPSTYDPTSDSYRLIAGNYDKDGNMVYGVSNEKGERDDELSEETKWWNAAGNTAVPFTEMIVGPVGEHIIPIEGLSDRVFGQILRDEFGNPINPTLGQFLRNEAVGAIGEGIEEDFGNVFEDWTQYGPRGMFANPIVDSDGNQVYDQAMHEARDYNTSLEDRLRNALDPTDLANAFYGGVSVDALMQSPFIPFKAVPALQRSRALRRTGVQQFVEPEQRERQELSRSYLEGFNDLEDDEEDER